MTGSPIPSRDVSLYIHVPFCSKKCPYCHFFVLPNTDKGREIFLDSLFKEWALRRPLLSDLNVVSIYFGGGTPSLLPPDCIKKILETLRKGEHSIDPYCEITIEANPEQVTRQQMALFQKMGINRVSLGVQSFDADLLRTLGRTHSADQAIEAIYHVRDAGIDNLSIDLMFELPHQTLKSWENSLQKLSALPLSHLSLYNLVFEPGTSFHKRQKALSPYLPTEEENLSLLKMAISYLEACSLKRYEISAFAKNERYSVHNTGYWMGRPFLGLGPSAFSYWEHRRFKNITHLNKYADMLEKDILPEDFSEELSQDSRLKELLAIQLRMLKGVCLNSFQQKNGLLPSSLFHTLESLQKKGWLSNENGQLLLTEEGLLFYDSVATEII